MTKGPSPLIPLLLVVALGLLLRGIPFPINLNLPLVSDAENAVLMCFLFIPFLLLLAIYSSSHSIILPLALVLGTYVVTTMFIGPLMLILFVYLACACLPSFNCNGEELGWGCVVLIGFFLLQWFLSEEGHQSGALVLPILILIWWYYFSS